MLPEEGELIPVPSLKVDFATNDVKEATASQTERIVPFQNGPFAILEQVLDNTGHVCGGELSCEHLSYGGAPFNGLVGYLMVDGSLRIEVR